MTTEHQYISRKNEGDKVIIFERGNLVFVFNFHWNNSYSDYRVGCATPGKYKVYHPRVVDTIIQEYYGDSNMTDTDIIFSFYFPVLENVFHNGLCFPFSRLSWIQMMPCLVVSIDLTTLLSTSLLYGTSLNLFLSVHHAEAWTPKCLVMSCLYFTIRVLIHSCGPDFKVLTLGDFTGRMV